MIIPSATSDSGLSLSPTLWEDAGVKCLSFSLASLLIRPGLDVLKNIPFLPHYFAWKESWVLNAFLPHYNAQGLYPIHSSYDGSTYLFQPLDILALIARWKPSELVLPSGMIPYVQQLEKNTFFWISIEDAEAFESSGLAYGIYCPYDGAQSGFKAFVERVQSISPRPCYVCGDFTWDNIEVLLALNVEKIETNTPSMDAYRGKIYSKEGITQIDHAQWAHSFIPLDSACSCYTCASQMTYAYLHHLFNNTPLLAQRYLVLHNMAYCMQL